MFRRFFHGIRLSVLDFLDSFFLSNFLPVKMSDRAKKSFIIREGLTREKQH